MNSQEDAQSKVKCKFYLSPGDHVEDAEDKFVIPKSWMKEVTVPDVYVKCLKENGELTDMAVSSGKEFRRVSIATGKRDATPFYFYGTVFTLVLAIGFIRNRPEKSDLELPIL